MTNDYGYIMFNDADVNYGMTYYAVDLLMKWHRLDPVSMKEINRNNAMESVQNNRNPFIDYPILAEYLWGNKIGHHFSFNDAMASFDPDFVPGVSDGWREDPPYEAIENTNAKANADKKFIGGHLYIEINNHLYTITGQIIH